MDDVLGIFGFALTLVFFVLNLSLLGFCTKVWHYFLVLGTIAVLTAATVLALMWDDEGIIFAISACLFMIAGIVNSCTLENTAASSNSNGSN